MDEIIAEVILRDLGANGCLKGFWFAIYAAVAHRKGKTIKDAFRFSAEKSGITIQLARIRIGSMLSYMDRRQTEAYQNVFEGKKPSPNELVARLAELLKERQEEK